MSCHFEWNLRIQSSSKVDFQHTSSKTCLLSPPVWPLVCPSAQLGRTALGCLPRFRKLRPEVRIWCTSVIHKCIYLLSTSVLFASVAHTLKTKAITKHMMFDPSAIHDSQSPTPFRHSHHVKAQNIATQENAPERNTSSQIYVWLVCWVDEGFYPANPQKRLSLPTIYIYIYIYNQFRPEAIILPSHQPQIWF